MVKRIQYLDSLRGWAILGIILIHSGTPELYLYYPLIGKLISRGNLGVYAFFFISGLSLFISYHKKRSITSPLGFLTHRFIRLSPIYYLILIYIILTSHQHYPLTQIILAFSYLLGWHPYWSLHGIIGVEWFLTPLVTFYFLFPLIASKIKNSYQALVLTMTSQLLLIFPQLIHYLDIQFFHFNLSFNYLNLTFFNFAPLFALGILCYFFVFNKFTLTPNQKTKFITFVSLFMLLGIIISPSLINSSKTIFGLGLIGLIYSFQKYPLLPLNNPIIAYLGKISYHLYLTHLIGLSFARQVLQTYFSHFQNHHIWGSFVVCFSLGLGISIIISSLTQLLLEQAAHKMNNYFNFAKSTHRRGGGRKRS